MAIFHVHAAVISKGKMAGGARGFAQYLVAPERGHGTQPGQTREDLVAHGADHLPRWAHDDPAHFWAMADRYERGGRVHPGVVARTYQITLPRELSQEGQLALADDIRQTFFAGYPQSWALHRPVTREGDAQPHLHLMFSTRREESPSDRTPSAWFAQAARPGHDPLSGGVRKDRAWDHKQHLQGVRHGVAVLINAALEREGIADAVTHRTLDAQGLERPPLHYHARMTPDERARVVTRQAQHRTNGITQEYEREVHRWAWEEQKQREGLHDLSRAGVVAQVREQFRTQAPSRTHAEDRAPDVEDLDKVWDRPLIGNSRSRIYHLPTHKNYGDVGPQYQERFWTERDAQAAGFRRARNDHYGPGSGVALEATDHGGRSRAEDSGGRGGAVGSGTRVGQAGALVGRLQSLGRVVPREEGLLAGVQARLREDRTHEREGR